MKFSENLIFSGLLRQNYETVIQTLNRTKKRMVIKLSNTTWYGILMTKLEKWVSTYTYVPIATLENI